MAHRLALLVSGASGMLLPARALSILTARPDVERLHVVLSKGASLVLVHEEDEHGRYTCQTCGMHFPSEAARMAHVTRRHTLAAAGKHGCVRTVELCVISKDSGRTLFAA